MAVSIGQTFLARAGLRANYLPLFLSLSLALLWWAWPSKGRPGVFWWRVAMAGACAGLLQYTYLAARITPVLFILLGLSFLLPFRTGSTDVGPVCPSQTVPAVGRHLRGHGRARRGATAFLFRSDSRRFLNSKSSTLAFHRGSGKSNWRVLEERLGTHPGPWLSRRPASSLQFRRAAHAESVADHILLGWRNHCRIPMATVPCKPVCCSYGLACLFSLQCWPIPETKVQIRCV